MTENRAPRKVAIADHIWEAFEEMASQMGSDRDALINQAMFMFARLNGFIDSANGRRRQRRRRANGSTAAARPARAAGGPLAAAAPMRKPRPRPPPARSPMDDDPVRREVPSACWRPPPSWSGSSRARTSGGNEPRRSDRAGRRRAPHGRRSTSTTARPTPAGAALYMMLEGGELDRIAKDRFVIGRGKHCDFVINSGKVSREHAVIVREGGDFFIEDLGSSNGTWFNKQRIKRRKIEDGDEYFICSEKVKFVYR